MIASPELPNLPPGSMLAVIAWLYLATNALRVLSYLPQVVVVWRCRDGARSISLLTWGMWTLSHITATLYGVLVLRDAFFIFVSLVNLAGCGTVTLIAARRRVAARRADRRALDWTRA